MSRDFANESLSHDPIHGYIPFIARSGLPQGEAAEQDVIEGARNGGGFACARAQCESGRDGEHGAA